ncbi:glutamine amidotransferase [Myxococcota bacterium]|nr:glutamine amidotransferase [Myxococcota bacterium]
MLYSDGADTEGLTPEAARALGAKIGAPIYAVGFASDAAAPDLALRRVIADDFAFVHNTVTLDVELEARGLDVNRVPVTLKQDGTVIATKEATFDAGRARVAFEFKPHRIGKLVYEVTTPVQAGEIVESNNAKSLVLKVIRDRIRVLQVAGRPSWDERFLRELLKRNPNVDLISFFILRSTTDQQKAPQEELALIPFPVNDLFTTELPTFDVVIYQNFNFRPYHMGQYLPKIRDFVQKGGSFLMIGGDASFEDGFYGDTPLGEILPVITSGAAPWDAGEYTPRLTKEGRRHPITRIGEPGEPPENVYQRLPALAGFNNSTALAPGAQALLVHPSLPGNPPLVSIREVGQGRTMAVNTDSLWFWRFPAVADGGAGREFDRFWSSALRWLIKDPELARVRVKAERSVISLGDPVGAEVKVLGPDYQGLGSAAVITELLAVDGAQRESVARQEGTTGPEGTVLAQFEDVAPGTYVLRASATVNGERLGQAEEPVIVEAADLEYQAPFPRPDILRALAEGSGGKFFDVGDRLPKLDIKDTRRVEVDRTKRVTIWDTMPIFLALLALAGLEWWLRRRSGLL